ncbi:C40 family peptidase [Lysinibacillus telephonicus]|uniref:LysM peptidoglycan-binding domain-containing protein n=1 Tax=Lysinibacillus telephonicus TaxID=1714840 RepID=A0A3S0J4G5_9BACI|nr:LysM peptidoglycan-binding domain-containing protein [Lysinibacillus telephonicus]RTQ94338.1 LysM peptidoglycan-binding domain-containing protein [Lysinibacillus telephonicus]
MIQNKKLLLLSSAIIATSVIAAPIAEASTYTVQKGDTLTKIAKANGTTVQQLKAQNNLNNDLIFIGQKLVMPNSSNLNEAKSKGTNKPSSEVKNNGSNNNQATRDVKKETTSVTSKSQQNNLKEAKTATYTVAKGDTLTKIAKLFNVNVAQLKEWNNLKSDTIFIGQTLKIGNSSTTADLGEPVQQAERDKLGETNKQIEEQLANEASILSNTLGEGQVVYDKVIEIANSLLGTPYLYGGNTPAGFDCSGFVRYVYAEAGLNIVRKSSKDYFFNDTTVVESPVPGDLVFFKDTYEKGISHMGIYIGNGEFIHAGTKAVELTKLEYEYWDSHFVAFKRFKQLNSKY